MTAHTSWRRRSASVLATATAVLLAASGALMAPAAAFAEEAPAAPQLSISKPVLDPAGDTLTVVGTGFDASAKGLPSYYGCADSAEAPQGVYVQLGWVKDNWRPSTGGVSKTDRNGVEQAWFADKDKNCQAPSKWTIAEDGTASFEHTFDVSEEKLGALPEGARYAVFTHGLTGRAPAISIPGNELEKPFTFAPEVVAPIAKATPNVTAADESGLQVAVSATDLPADVKGLYAALIVKGTEASMDQNSTYPAFALPFPAVANGASSFVLSADKANLDRTQQYEVLLWKQHSPINADTIYTRADVQIAEANWDAVFPPVTEIKPEISVTASAKLAAGLEITANLKNIVSPTGAYVSVIEAGTSGDLTQDNMGLGAEWVRASQFTGGAATVKLSIAKKLLDRSKKYEVISWEGHTLPTKETIYGVVNLDVSSDQWDTAMKDHPFTDVAEGQAFSSEISWMFNNGITTGVTQQDGSVKYEPKWKISREAVAAFLYRQYGDPKFKAPATSPFNDVKSSDPFYKEIAWMAHEKISTGVNAPGGKLNFQPKAKITREAMAAFMYRVDDSKKPAAPNTSPFADMKPTSKFYKEIAWMHSTGLSTGVAQTSGKPKYEPKWQISREATGAFLARHDALAK